MTEIILKKPQFLAAASLFASKDMYRYYLNGVLIEPDPLGGVFLVATDGHRMVVFRDPEGMTDKPHILPVSKRLFNACKFSAKAGERELIADGDLIHLYEKQNEDEPDARIDVSIYCEIDGTFPDWRRAFQEIKVGMQGVSDSVNHTLLAAFSSMIKAAYGTKADALPIRLVQFGPAPMLILHEQRDWFGLLMPLRSKQIENNQLPFDIGIEPEAEAEPDSNQKPAIAAE